MVGRVGGLEGTETGGLLPGRGGVSLNSDNLYVRELQCGKMDLLLTGM